MKFRFFFVIVFLLAGAILASMANNWLIYAADNSLGNVSLAKIESADLDGVSLVSPHNFETSVSVSISSKRANSIFQSSLPGDSCVQAFSISNGVIATDPFLSFNATKQLVPASTNKYVTAAVVLSTFSRDDTLDTSLVASSNEASIEKAYVRTSGDPSFVSTTTPHPRRPAYLSPNNTHTFENFAQETFDAGVRSISNLVIDDKWFELAAIESGWSDDRNEVGQLAALNIDEGFDGAELAADPADHAAQVLKSTFEQKGISIGTISYSSIPDSLSGDDKIISKTSSAKIKTLVSDLLRTSDNVYAEQLLAAAVHKKAGVVTKEKMRKFVLDTLDDLKIDRKSYIFENGSGYSTKSKLTCKMENDLIVAMAKKGIDLPGMAAVSGQDGTLKLRFSDSDKTVTAKTGSLNNVTALTGRIGQDVQFAFISNGDFSTDGGYDLGSNVVSTLSTFPFINKPDFSTSWPN